VNSVIFLTLRRLRTPLLILIAVYTIGITGLVLIPGVDREGKTAHLSFFQAFYFLSYTASTIGFGEIPYAFTDRQRLWVTVVIYLSVIGWAYTIAALLALARDTGFRNAVTGTTFRRRVRRIGETVLRDLRLRRDRCHGVSRVGPDGRAFRGARHR